MLGYLPWLLCVTLSAAQPADDSLAGVGVELRVEGPNIVVNRILPDTPAAAQKELHVGDRIVAVAQGDQPSVQVRNIVQAARSMRGPRGTTVRLTIIPTGQEESQARVVSFVRGEIKGL
jgi:carboxyl-terminal processing protease